MEATRLPTVQQWLTEYDTLLWDRGLVVVGHVLCKSAHSMLAAHGGAHVKGSARSRTRPHANAIQITLSGTEAPCTGDGPHVSVSAGERCFHPAAAAASADPLHIGVKYRSGIQTTRALSICHSEASDELRRIMPPKRPHLLLNGDQRHETCSEAVNTAPTSTTLRTRRSCREKTRLCGAA